MSKRDIKLANDDEKFLTPDELWYIKNAQLTEENRRSQLKIMDLEVALGNQQAETLRAKAEVVRQRTLTMRREHDDARQSHAKWMQDLNTRLGVKEGDRMGFDPETGKVTIVPRDS